jgi:hypothetical protein
MPNPGDPANIFQNPIQNPYFEGNLHLIPDILVISRYDTHFPTSL